MFAKANESAENSGADDGSDAPGTDDFIKQEPIPEAHEGERSGMYQCGQTGVTIASGGHDDPPYIVVMPDGTVHDAGLEPGDHLDIGTVNELLDLYGAQVY